MFFIHDTFYRTFENDDKELKAVFSTWEFLIIAFKKNLGRLLARAKAKYKSCENKKSEINLNDTHDPKV